MTEQELTKYINFDKTTKDVENYETYSKVRSKQLYYLISKNSAEFLEEEKVPYEEVSNIIRFDKSLKNKLYVFISTYEEYLKTQLYSLDKNSLEKIKNKFNLDRFSKNYIDWELKSGKSFISVYKIWIYIVQSLGITNSQITKNNLNRIRKLRNSVMHLAFLIFPLNEKWTKESIKKHLKKLNKKIETLKKSLPEPYPHYLKEKLLLCFESKNRINDGTKDKKINETLKGYVKSEIKIFT